MRGTDRSFQNETGKLVFNWADNRWDLTRLSVLMKLLSRSLFGEIESLGLPVEYRHEKYGTCRIGILLPLKESLTGHSIGFMSADRNRTSESLYYSFGECFIELHNRYDLRGNGAAFSGPFVFYCIPRSFNTSSVISSLGLANITVIP